MDDYYVNINVVYVTFTAFKLGQMYPKYTSITSNDQWLFKRQHQYDQITSRDIEDPFVEVIADLEVKLEINLCKFISFMTDAYIFFLLLMIYRPMGVQEAKVNQLMTS
jgi:hypothetical protein